MNDIKRDVEKLVAQRAKIPKPLSSATYLLVRMGESRGERAVVYQLPVRPGSKRASTKRIPFSAIETSARQLLAAGLLTRRWFASRFPKLEADGTCNFTTVGGILELLGYARYAGQGEYESTNPPR